jgi:acetylornithine deacetylase/succinyl-diaminopimelate desuccinylase-like protein
VFAAHLDVGRAPRLQWTTDPFRLTERNGELWGGGRPRRQGPLAAIDGGVIRARARGLVPERDLVFAFTAGRRAVVDDGVEWLLRPGRPLVDGEFALILDSGGGDVVDDRVSGVRDAVRREGVSTTSRWPRADRGHSSTPPDEDAGGRLARAILKVDAHHFPVRLNRWCAHSSGACAADAAGAERDAMSAIASEPDDLGRRACCSEARGCVTCCARLCDHDAPRRHRSQRDPQEAVATVNCRLLPVRRRRRRSLALAGAVGDTRSRSVSQNGAGERGLVATRRFSRHCARVVDAGRARRAIIPYMEGEARTVSFSATPHPRLGVNGFYLDDENHRAHARARRAIPVPAFRLLVRHTERLLAECCRHARHDGPAR